MINKEHQAWSGEVARAFWAMPDVLVAVIQAEHYDSNLMQTSNFLPLFIRSDPITQDLSCFEHKQMQRNCTTAFNSVTQNYHDVNITKHSLDSSLLQLLPDILHELKSDCMLSTGLFNSS
jgi:hypothetical protein